MDKVNSEFLELTDRYQKVLKKIQVACASRKSPGSDSSVTLVVVSKFQSFEKMRHLYLLGQRDFGENYVQELLEKSERFKSEGIEDIRFHFIGNLQSNKVKAVLPVVHSIQSVGSFRLLEEIEKKLAATSINRNVMFQLNIDEENSKSGFKIDDLSELAEQVKKMKWIIPQGLMIIPDPNLDSASSFQRLSALSVKWGAVLGLERSMGMSDDFESAIQHGSTCVRLGTVLMGPRYPVTL
jgi:pyridoxal phosphate enzyme (YggS family)